MRLGVCGDRMVIATAVFSTKKTSMELFDNNFVVDYRLMALHAWLYIAVSA